MYLLEVELMLYLVYNIVRVDYYLVYLNNEGFLSEVWRKSICIFFWGICIEEEIKDMVLNVIWMKNEGIF